MVLCYYCVISVSVLCLCCFLCISCCSSRVRVIMFWWLWLVIWCRFIVLLLCRKCSYVLGVFELGRLFLCIMCSSWCLMVDSL